MKSVFWVSAAVVVYTYAGYPLWLCLRSIWRTRPVRSAPSFPTISIVMAVHNEARVLPEKLANLSQLNYPADRYEIVIASDGSTDSTNALLESRAGGRLRLILCPEHIGKAAALNRAISAARGEVVVFTDARQTLQLDALCRLAENFADPEVGGVSGELMLGRSGDPKALRGVDLYWKLEKKVRQWEGLTGSVIGATGALYAARRELLCELPIGTILDDLYLPMQVVRRGRRMVFDSRARAWDTAPGSTSAEFRRRVRTLTGNYQLMQLSPWLLTRENPVRFEFLSHKILRLLVPFFLAGALMSSLILGGSFYHGLGELQVLFYGSAVLALIPAELGGLRRIANIALTFVVLNIAAVVALLNFVTGKKAVWARRESSSARISSGAA